MNRNTVPHSVLHSAWKFLSLKILINPEKNEAPKEGHFQGRAPVLTSSALKCFSHVAVQQLQLQRTTHLTLGRKKLVFCFFLILELLCLTLLPSPSFLLRLAVSQCVPGVCGMFGLCRLAGRSLWRLHLVSA